MKNTKNQTKKFIKKYPEMFSIKRLLLQKSPTKKLKIFKTIFFLSPIITGTINNFIRTNTLVFTALILINIILEIPYPIIFRTWLKNNSYYTDLSNIEYFLKNQIYLKNDYFIMYGKVSNYNKTNRSNVKNLLLIKNNTILSAIIIGIIITMISKTNVILNYLLSNIQGTNKKLILTITVVLLLLTYTIYMKISDFKSKKYIVENALKETENQYFSKTTGEFKINLLIEKLKQSEVNNEFNLIKKYIKDHTSSCMTK